MKEKLYKKKWSSQIKYKSCIIKRVKADDSFIALPKEINFFLEHSKQTEKHTTKIATKIVSVRQISFT